MKAAAREGAHSGDDGRHRRPTVYHSRQRQRQGISQRDRDKLTEPYVTTRAEGTGLGLPIVIKILEDHGGRVELLDGLPREDGGVGAQVRLTLPIAGDQRARRAFPGASADERELL